MSKVKKKKNRIIFLINQKITFNNFHMLIFQKHITKDFPFKCEHIWTNIWLFKVSNKNTRKRCEICSKVTIKTPEQSQWRRSGVFIVTFEHISHLFLAFLLLTLNNLMLAGIAPSHLLKKFSMENLNNRNASQRSIQVPAKHLRLSFFC